MAKTLFVYAIIHNPKETKDSQGNDTTKDSSIIVDPSYELATNDAEVRIIASRDIPEEYLDKLDEVQILVRPF